MPTWGHVRNADFPTLYLLGAQCVLEQIANIIRVCYGWNVIKGSAKTR